MHDSNLVNASFWMMPQKPMNPADPINTGIEMDIMECINPDRENVSQTTHWYDKKNSFSGGTRARHVPGLSKGFHTFSLEWTPEELIFRIDGVESWRVNAKEHPIPGTPHHVILSFGAKWREVLKKPADFSSTYTVDYVRVYQK